jgi:TRAP-type C4-dicarboxylate transport system substrate-binding protein
VLAQTKKYKVECKGFYGGTVAKLGEVLETVESGLADIGHILSLAEMAKIDPYNLTFWVPFSTDNMEKVLKAYSKTVDHFSIFEEVLTKCNQIRLGHAYTLQDSYQIISNVPVKTMEDLKGVKIAHAGSFLPMIAALGATPVQAVYTEIYTSMDTGVFNGFTMPATSAVAFRIQEVGKHFIKPNLGAMIAGVLTINAKKMKKLPKEVQEILVEVGNAYSFDMIKRAKAFEGAALAAMKKAGVEIYTLPQKEQARWADSINNAGVLAKSMRNCNAKGLPCSDIAKFYVKALEEEGYKFPYKPILE